MTDPPPAASGAPTPTPDGRTRFDLLAEPWLPAQLLDGRHVELSLTEVFRRAHECRGLTGELPTTMLALTRLLLAVFYRTIGTDRPTDAWAELWRAPALPADLVADYLGHHADRFDLFHPETPFYQVAGLRSAKGEVKGLDALVADVPNNEKHFTTRAGSGLARMDYAEAARWVVHAMAYDASGIKTGAVGDPRVKGGKGYPIGTAWAGQLGGLLATGQNLRETLLLNLVLARDGVLAGQPKGTPWPEDDLPVWERDPLGAAEEEGGGRLPTGPADLLTWPSRRLRLVHDGSAVTGVVLCNGDRLHPADRHHEEPMTTWRRSRNQEKLLKRKPVYMPRAHDPDRALWRGLSSLLPEGTRDRQLAGESESLPAMTLDWLATLRRAQYAGEPVLAADQLVVTRAIGMGYGSNDSVVAEVVDDALAFQVDILADRQLRMAAVEAVKRTEEAVHALGQLASNLAVAAGGDGDGRRERVRQEAYHTLDRPFRDWLGSLGPGSDQQQAKQVWFDTARELIRTAGEELVDSAGPVAWVGRDDKGRHVSTPEADIRFRGLLRRHLPRDVARPDDPDTSVEIPAPSTPEEVPA